jgi:pyruvate/2-oxoglutarate dehydrogenase complex dihydrolipoamide dehydrogenase (E3) component
MAVEYDLVVIGGGSGGLVVAGVAAALNAKVALIEKDRLGGDCLWYGCVPSKSLIHASRLAYQVKNAGRFGIYSENISIDFAKVIAHVQNVISNIAPHDSPERFEGLGAEVIFGDGEFIDRRTFKINGRSIKARAFVISTGSRPAIPKVSGLKEAGYITNEEVFSITERPETLAIIGGGPIGCELGQALSRLGSEVTIIAGSSRLLPQEDPEVAQIVANQFNAENIRVLTKTHVEKVEVINGKKVLWAAGEKIAEVEQILVAAGRQPNIESLNLQAAGVEMRQKDEAGYGNSGSKKGIRVNSKLQTTNPRIYACGDVIGGYQFTHVAGYEANIVLRNALFLPVIKANYRVIPWATFTDPELARVGLTEQEARSRYGDEIAIVKQEYADVDRAQAENATIGFAKIIVRRNGQILGAHLVGASAGELIHEIVLAMTHKLKISALSGIHIYPTLSELNSNAAFALTQQNYEKSPRLQKLLAKGFQLLRAFG